MPKVPLGKIDEVPPGRSRTFAWQGKKILVANVGGELKGYENLCPHMGGAVRYDGKRLVCGWHGAMFDPATGVAQAGITEGSKLTPLVVSLENGLIMFDSDSFPKSPWAMDF